MLMLLFIEFTMSSRQKWEIFPWIATGYPGSTEKAGVATRSYSVSADWLIGSQVDTYFRFKSASLLDASNFKQQDG